MLALLSVAFGVLALTLAAIGLYGVVAFVVTRRTAEIGLRIALGAPSRRVLWMVLREALLLTAVGVLIGAPASLAAGRMARSILFGVTPDDPRIVVAGVLILFFIGSVPRSPLHVALLLSTHAGATNRVKADCPRSHVPPARHNR